MNSTVLVVILAAVVGAVAAWVATVPLYRYKEFRPKTPRDVSNEGGLEIRAVSRHARCPRCHTDTRTSDVVPVLGWVRGCPGCPTRFPASLVTYQLVAPLAAAATAVAFTATSAGGDLGAISLWNTAIYVLFGFVVTSVSLVDARIWLIPWWIPWVGSAAGGAVMVVAAVSVGELDPLVTAGIGAVVAFVLFFVLWFVAPGRLGFGDVRLAFMIGLFLGWLSPVLVIWGLMIGSFVGVLVGVWTIARRNGGHFAFGPALSIGALVAVWAHDLLLN